MAPGLKAPKAERLKAATIAGVKAELIARLQDAMGQSLNGSRAEGFKG